MSKEPHRLPAEEKREVDRVFLEGMKAIWAGDAAGARLRLAELRSLKTKVAEESDAQDPQDQ